MYVSNMMRRAKAFTITSSPLRNPVVPWAERNEAATEAKYGILKGTDDGAKQRRNKVFF